VSKAAERMNVSQPTMSHTLARLRTLLHDPILVRTPQGLVPTEHALKLAKAIREGLAHIDSALQGRLGFDPAAAELCFTIFASDYVSPLFLPNLMAEVRQAAPQVNLCVGLPDSSRMREDLEERNCDVIIGYYPAPVGGLRSPTMFRESTLFQEPLCCVVRADHPLVQRQLSIEQFTQLPHIAYAPRGPNSSSLERTIDALLREKGLRRRLALCHHEMRTMPAVIARTDLIATIPQSVIMAHAEQASLQLMRPPIELTEIAISMMWSEGTHQEEACRWIRRVIRKVATRTALSPPSSSSTAPARR